MDGAGDCPGEQLGRWWAVSWLTALPVLHEASMAQTADSPSYLGIGYPLLTPRALCCWGRHSWRLWGSWISPAPEMSSELAVMSTTFPFPSSQVQRNTERAWQVPSDFSLLQQQPGRWHPVCQGSKWLEGKGGLLSHTWKVWLRGKKEALVQSTTETSRTPHGLFLDLSHLC